LRGWRVGKPLWAHCLSQHTRTLTCSGLRLAVEAGVLVTSGSLAPLMAPAAPVEGERLGGGRLAPFFVSLVAGKTIMTVADGSTADGAELAAPAAGFVRKGRPATPLEAGLGAGRATWDKRCLGGGGRGASRTGGGSVFAALTVVALGGASAGKVSSSETEKLAAPSWKGLIACTGPRIVAGVDSWVTFGLLSSWTVYAARAGVVTIAVQVTKGVSDAEVGSTEVNACVEGVGVGARAWDLLIGVGGAAWQRRRWRSRRSSCQPGTRLAQHQPQLRRVDGAAWSLVAVRCLDQEVDGVGRGHAGRGLPREAGGGWLLGAPCKQWQQSRRYKKPTLPMDRRNRRIDGLIVDIVVLQIAASFRADGPTDLQPAWCWPSGRRWWRSGGSSWEEEVVGGWRRPCQAQGGGPAGAPLGAIFAPRLAGQPSPMNPL
jgi:hypothetical protein